MFRCEPVVHRNDAAIEGGGKDLEFGDGGFGVAEDETAAVHIHDAGPRRSGSGVHDIDTHVGRSGCAADHLFRYRNRVQFRRGHGCKERPGNK